MTVAKLVFAATFTVFFSHVVMAKDINVTENLQQAIDDAQAGDRLILAAGTYNGSINIDKSLSIIGTENTIIKGDDVGNVITVTGSDISLSNFTVTGSGLLLETQDSGVFLSKPATNIEVRNLKILDNLIGVYVWGATNATVADNVIRGRQDLRVNERGNGVQLWNAPGAVVENNDIQFGRDGIFTTTNKRNIYRNNYIHQVRFAIHYMYTNDSIVENNISEGNTIGYAIMFSKKVEVLNNQSIDDKDRGILFNYANGVEIIGNQVYAKNNPQAAQKCLFIYNSNDNDIKNNYFANCEIGVHFTAGSEKNIIQNNAFVNNQTQVKYVGTKWIDWSAGGVGNYWSDNSAFDLDGDGIADNLYRPNDLTDQILWRYPAAKLLINSPAVQVLRWAQSAFPALHPGGVVDSAPLMKIPAKLTNFNSE
ncbi:MAG: nitrous oxide reductase family maturation protein NosD [Alphaproteobacteria bacterium]|nr:nitrous oxide reductase family maturation protein NosD [Alphaproteobacteria bacterium]